MKNRLFVAGLFLFLLLFLFTKDRVFLHALRGTSRRFLPQSELKVGSGHIGLGALALKDFSVTKKRKDLFDALEIKGGDLTLRFSVLRILGDPLPALKEGHLSFEVLRYGVFSLDGFDLRCSRRPKKEELEAAFSFSSLRFREFEASDFQGRLSADAKTVVLEEVTGSALGGKVSASGSCDYQAKEKRLAGVINLDAIEFRSLLALFGAGRGLDVSGVFSGKLVIQARGNDIEELAGRLDSANGGRFFITDPSAFADNRLKLSKEANIVIENLKNYHYDIGKIEIRNYGQDIKMDIFLEGETGKRQLEVFWHREGVLDEKVQ